MMVEDLTIQMMLTSNSSKLERARRNSLHPWESWFRAPPSRAGWRLSSELGTCCLVQDNEDSLYHRAEIREVSQDGRVKLFLIEVDKVVLVESSNLLTILPENLSQEPSLLIKVSLRGLKPLVSWSEMDKNIAKNVLNLGGETKLQITDPKFVDGKLFINAKNIKGEDLASCLLEYGYPADERTKGKL